LGDKRGLLHTLAGLSGWLGVTDQLVRAVEIAGAVTTLSKTLQWPLDRPGSGCWSGGGEGVSNQSSDTITRWVTGRPDHRGAVEVLSRGQ
jgi:hypothetical protein